MEYILDKYKNYGITYLYTTHVIVLRNCIPVKEFKKLRLDLLKQRIKVEDIIVEE